MKHALALAAVMVALPAIAHAEATTYQGTLGDKKIVVEFSDAPDPRNTELFGRYFYLDQGADIPLHATKAQRSRLGLVEEVPCSEDKNNCPNAQDETPSNPPLGAKWELEVSDDGRTLEGDFKLNGRNTPVKLERLGTREFDPAGGMITLTDFATSLWYSGAILSVDTSPYDYLKVTGIKLGNDDPEEMTGGTFRYVSDPRTKFQFPRIVSVVDDSDTAAANAFLDQRHWKMSLDALYCVSQQYQGFGWNGDNYDAGTLGWWDEEEIEVQFLTPSVMTWTEGGSLSCGYAHPNNHYEYYNLDVKTGELIDLSRIFRGWIAKDFDGNVVDLDIARASPTDYQWGPDAELLAFVNEHRPSNAELGFAGGEDDCPIDDLIATNLAISFRGDDIVHFGMDGLEYAVQACASDLYDAPLADLRDLLTPEAADYFPSLGT